MNFNETFQKEEQQQWLEVAAGVERKITGYNDDVMMVKVRFKKDAVGVAHQHIHTQSSYVAKGTFEVTIDNVPETLHEGDSFFVQPNLVHGVVCKEAGILIDVFNPCRMDFL
jgi:quercetin dioxygenase-like cupin family protein